METTIQSYREVLEHTEKSSGDSKLKKQLRLVIKLNDAVNQEKSLKIERKKQSVKKIKDIKVELGKINEEMIIQTSKLNEMKEGLGISKDKYKEAKNKKYDLKDQIKKLDRQLEK